MVVESQYWLRHLNQDLVLPLGSFTVGRSSACDLTLDDPLVSREHAIITVDANRAWISDKSSRNGLLVNGMKALERTSLGHADRITIGSSDLFFLEQSRLQRDQKITQPALAKVSLDTTVRADTDTLTDASDDMTSKANRETKT